MNEQPEFDFDAPGEAPEVSEAEIAQLLTLLAGPCEEKMQRWFPGRVIQAALGWDERKVRAASRAARPRVVSYPGSKGYKLWELCTVPEHDKCLKAFRAQRDDMDASLLIFTRAYHSHYLGGNRIAS